MDTRRSLVNTRLSITFTQCIIFNNCNRILLAIPQEEMNTLLCLKLRTCGKFEDEIAMNEKKGMQFLFTPTNLPTKVSFSQVTWGAGLQEVLKPCPKGRQLKYVDIYIVMTKNQKNSIHRFLNTCCNEHTILKNFYMIVDLCILTYAHGHQQINVMLNAINK